MSPNQVEENIPASVDCVVVGGGPGGMVLGYMLARQGVRVVVLEAAQDFDRPFRGDTLQPSAMEILDDLGLAEGVLALPHKKIHEVVTPNPDGTEQVISYDLLGSKYPFITVISQPLFLSYMVDQGEALGCFQMLMGVRAKALVEEKGKVKGVEVRTKEGTHTIKAQLVVGADGRFSTVRKLSGLPVLSLGQTPYDILWFHMPVEAGDPKEGMLNLAIGDDFFVMFQRPNEWQVGCVIPKDAYATLKQAPPIDFLRGLAQAHPHFASRLEALDDWRKLSLLSVQMSRAQKWYREGLLLIGDAAHVMSPVGGVGINLAIQDAAVAAMALGKPLREQRLSTHTLHRIQKRRNLDTKMIQGIQVTIQKASLRRASQDTKDTTPPKKPPKWLKWLGDKVRQLWLFRYLPVRLFGLGIRRVRVKAKFLQAPDRG